jgi:hypothetical protein
MRAESGESGPERPVTLGYLAADAEFVEEALAPATLERIAAAPGFPEIMRRYAGNRLDAYAATSAPLRWLTRDLARAALFFTALVRDAILGGATVANLCESAKADRTCSRGRVLAWVEGARELG